MPKDAIEKVIIGDDEYQFKTSGDDYLLPEERGEIESGDEGWIAGGDVFAIIGEAPEEPESV